MNLKPIDSGWLNQNIRFILWDQTPTWPNQEEVEERATGFGGDEERPIEPDDGRDWALDGADDGPGSEDRATGIGSEERPIGADEDRETEL